MACAAFIFIPQPAATTFAFSSVWFLFYGLKWWCHKIWKVENVSYAAWVLVGKAGAEHVAGDTARGWAPVAGFAPVVGPHLHLHLNHKVLM